MLDDSLQKKRSDFDNEISELRIERTTELEKELDLRREIQDEKIKAIENEKSKEKVVEESLPLDHEEEASK